jgi:hypothetical protein
MIPQHYETILLALAQSNAQEGGDGSVSAALGCALAHGLNPDEQSRALSACVVALSADSFARRPASEWLRHFRPTHPLAWIVYLPDTWDTNGAASLWWSDEAYALRQKRALAHVSASASNQNGPTASQSYPLVLPQYLEQKILALASHWSVSPGAALHAVFRKHGAAIA